MNLSKRKKIDGVKFNIQDEWGLRRPKAGIGQMYLSRGQGGGVADQPDQKLWIYQTDQTLITVCQTEQTTAGPWNRPN